MEPQTPLTATGRAIRRATIMLAQAHGGYHFGGSFSVVEILCAFFDHCAANDLLVFSKGHGCWPLYVMLRAQGKTPLLEGHPKRDPANGIAYTTGSLGHGLPAAVGMAAARQIAGKRGRIVVVIGEGDVQEGTFWESLLIAGRHRLDNLTVMLDSNGIQGSGRVDEILPCLRAAIEAAYGALWSVDEADGHDVSALAEAMFRAGFFPHLVIAHTVKGRGVSFMENDPAWHAHGLDATQTAQALAELT